MNGNVNRLDHSLDIIILFLTVISAALFQYVTAIPYDLANQTQVKAYLFLTEFYLKLLFLPFLAIIPSWLMMQVVRNEKWRMVLRFFVWIFSSMTMALNVIAQIIISFPEKIEINTYPGNVIAIIIVIIPFILVAALQNTIFKAYRRAILDDLSSPARDFYYEQKRTVSVILLPIVISIIWLAIFWLAII